MTRPDAIARRAARVIVLDATDRVLLLHGYDPARPEHRYWFTVGGGLDPGESGSEAAARELFEETGLRVAPSAFAEPVWRDHDEFQLDGRWYRQDQEFYVIRADAFEVDSAGFSDLERRSVDGHRWWSVGELRATTERFYPPDLPDRLLRLTC